MNTEHNRHIYRLRFNSPPFKAKGDFRTDFHFTTLAAIYTLFDAEIVGCSLETLWKNKVSEGKPFNTKYCTATKERLYSKPQEHRRNTPKG